MNRRAIAVAACSLILAGSSAFADNPPNADVSPSSHTFPSLCKGQTSAPTTFVLTNNGGSTLDVSSIDIAGNDPNEFALSAPGQSFSLPPGETQNFTVAFHPSSHGDKSAKVTVHASNASNASAKVYGTGVDRQITSDASTVAFGNQRVGTRSPTKTLTIHNPGSDSLTVTSVKLTGAAAADFVVTVPGSSFTVAPANFRTLTVAFQPRAAGLRTGSLEITSDACSAPKMAVALVGTGVVPNVAVAPNPIDVGASPQGVPGQPAAVTLTNSGGAPLKVSAVQILGADASDFALAGLPSMPATVAPGDSFIFNVSMTAAAQGPRAASLNVVSDDPDTPALAIPLHGTGGTPGRRVPWCRTRDRGAVPRRRRRCRDLLPARARHDAALR